MRVLLNVFRKIFLNEYLILFFIIMHEKFLTPQINKAWSIYLRSKIENIHETVRFHGRSVITCPSRLKIEKYVRVGRGCFFFCDGGLSIGEGSILSRYITIYTGNHNIDGGAIPYDNSYNYKSVTIGKGVWIGMNVSITPGVSIGDGAVIGMGTVVSRNVLQGEIVVGASQRVVGHRDMSEFSKKINCQDFFGRNWPDA